MLVACHKRVNSLIVKHSIVYLCIADPICRLYAGGIVSMGSDSGRSVGADRRQGKVCSDPCHNECHTCRNSHTHAIAMPPPNPCNRFGSILALFSHSLHGRFCRHAIDNRLRKVLKITFGHSKRSFLPKTPLYVFLIRFHTYIIFLFLTFDAKRRQWFNTTATKIAFHTPNANHISTHVPS